MQPINRQPKRWSFKCPICNKHARTRHTMRKMTRRSYEGVTTDCPRCYGLLMIGKRLRVTDFGKELSRRYAEMGVTVSPEVASKSFIEF